MTLKVPASRFPSRTCLRAYEMSVKPKGAVRIGREPAVLSKRTSRSAELAGEGFMSGVGWVAPPKKSGKLRLPGSIIARCCVG